MSSNIKQFRVEVQADNGTWHELTSAPSRLAAIRQMDEIELPCRVVDIESGTTFTRPTPQGE